MPKASTHVEFTHADETWSIGLWPLEEWHTEAAGWRINLAPPSEDDDEPPVRGVLARDIANLLQLTLGAVQRVMREAGCARQRTSYALKFSSKAQKQACLSRGQVKLLAHEFLNRPSKKRVDLERASLLAALARSMPNDEQPPAEWATQRAEELARDLPASVGEVGDALLALQAKLGPQLEARLEKMLHPLFEQQTRRVLDLLEERVLAKIEEILRIHNSKAVSLLVDTVEQLNSATVEPSQPPGS